MRNPSRLLKRFIRYLPILRMQEEERERRNVDIRALFHSPFKCRPIQAAERGKGAVPDPMLAHRPDVSKPPLRKGAYGRHLAPIHAGQAEFRLVSYTCSDPASSPQAIPPAMKLRPVGNTLILTVPKRVAEAMG